MKQRYASLPGDIVGLPPYVAKDCLMHAMFVKGDTKNQQRLCDLALNEPTDNAFAFSVMTSWVLVTSIYVESMGSGDPLDKSKGVVSEVDIGLWSLVSGLEKPKSKKRKLYWLPSYLFVDSSAAMAAGREVFGYPKSVGEIVRKSTSPMNASVDVDIWHFRKFSPTERPVKETIMKVSGPPRKNETHDISSIEEISTFLAEFLPAAAARQYKIPLPDAGMPQIMLQQIRDAETPHFAALKEIICVSPKPKNISNGGFLKGQYSLELAKSASHPVAETLGLKKNNKVLGGIWLEYDFDVGLGRKIWSS
ncbi:MAG: hypothetical protein ABJN65_02330 [Parasphingorhabdus sp.]